MKKVGGVLWLILLAPGGMLSGRAGESPESLHRKASAVLAQLQGEIRVPGLQEPVEILRDRWGIPTSTRRMPMTEADGPLVGTTAIIKKDEDPVAVRYG